MDDFDAAEETMETTGLGLEEQLEEFEEPKKELPDFMKLLESPIAQGLLGGCKDMFKKKEVDPNICEITIKAPSEVVLKLFKVAE